MLPAPSSKLPSLALLFFAAASRFTSAYSHASDEIYARDALADAEAYDAFDDFDFTDLMHRRHADAEPDADAEAEAFDTFDDFDFTDLKHRRYADADAEADPEPYADAEPEPEPLFGLGKKKPAQLTGCCAQGSAINGKQRLICRGNPAWGGIGANGMSCDNLKVGDKCDAGPPGPIVNANGGESCASLLRL